MAYALLKGRKISKRTGKMTAAKIPLRKSSPNKSETIPTTVGPPEQPTSPPKARRANSSVPPPFKPEAERLKVPGHKMPTERPHKPQPISPRMGEEDKEISK